MENKELIEMLARIDVSMTYLVNEMKEQKDSLTKLDATIRGNGKVGLITEVEQIKKWIETRTWFERIIISVLAAEAIGILMVVIQTYMHAAN